jgi:hypothetical protein
MRGSASARLLRFRVRIPPGAWVVLCCECCALSSRGICVGLISRTGGPCGGGCVVVGDGESQIGGSPGPGGGGGGGLSHRGKKKFFYMFRPMKVHRQVVSCGIQAYGIMLCQSVYGVVVHH